MQPCFFFPLCILGATVSSHASFSYWAHDSGLLGMELTSCTQLSPHGATKFLLCQWSQGTSQNPRRGRGCPFLQCLTQSRDSSSLRSALLVPVTSQNGWRNYPRSKSESQCSFGQTPSRWPLESHSLESSFFILNIQDIAVDISHFHF